MATEIIGPNYVLYIVNLWNSLPEDVVSAPTANSFRDVLTVTVHVESITTAKTSVSKDQSTGLRTGLHLTAP